MDFGIVHFFLPINRKPNQFQPEQLLSFSHFFDMFHGDDPIGDIDARLCRNLEVAFYYVLEVRIERKLVTCLGLERL
jgi:hypothetical protein